MVNDSAARTNYGLIALIMFAILGACLAGAWAISASRERYVHRGTQVVEQIRRSGLRAFWKGPGQTFYLMQAKQTNFGYEVDLRVPTKEGGFEGLSLVVQELRGVSGVYEHWVLNANATEGSYNAGRIGPGGSVRPDTRIELRQGNVNVQQVYHEVAIPSQAKVPSNYLPEGTLMLAAHLVAREKGKAFCKSILNSEIPPGKAGEMRETRFSLANMEYKRQASLTVNNKTVDASVVELRYGGLGTESAVTLYLGADGTVLRQDRSEESSVMVSLPELAVAFPGAHDLIIQVAKRVKFDLSGLDTSATPKQPQARPAAPEAPEGYD